MEVSFISQARLQGTWAKERLVWASLLFRMRAAVLLFLLPITVLIMISMDKRFLS